ncbi:FMN-dependent dehydrogenase-domain-containing protein [Xylaria intraflava]|nr:FMN-dependent dehydrogenase-domain-containing protein [Xylaria intraflava]
MPEETASRSAESPCWIVMGNRVYDVKPYLHDQPGGSAVLTRQDGPGGLHETAESRRIHLSEILERLPVDACLGTIDEAARASFLASIGSTNPTGGGLAVNDPPHLSSIIVPNDFEAAAKVILSAKQWTFIASSAHDASALRNNLASWKAIRLRPQIFRDVRTVDPRCRILGAASPFPFFVSPMGRWGYEKPSGEISAYQALARRGVHGVLSSESTASMEDITTAFDDEKRKVAAARKESASGKLNEHRPEAQLHYQLYIPSDKAIAIQRIRRARSTGAFRSLWVTVDAPLLGKRSADRRLQAAEALGRSAEEAERAGFGFAAHAKSNEFNASLTWDDVKWIKGEWGGPVVLKGVQTAEDAARAANLGIDGVLLSNHGGRQMHDAVDALTTLLEIRTYYPALLDRLEIFVDGGCRDGADILKAVALGARAVGVGRPFFYAFDAYGEKGIERCADIFVDELLTGMKLAGMRRISEACPDHVNASRLLNEIWRPEQDRS